MIKKMSLRYLFMDFDSFFAAVEQQYDPALRGRPVGVVPGAVGVQTTCCIAASYEAKRMGVKTGTGVREARQLCPQIRFVSANHERYVDVHHRSHQAIEPLLHIEKIESIDECYGRLPPHWQVPEVAAARAREIKAALAREIGPLITVSIGLAPNRFLAKMASKMHKPNGLHAIDHADLPQALYSFELSDLTGIGKQMLARLHRNGITTVERLCNASASELGRIWGSIYGLQMWKQLRGEEVAEIETTRQTVSHSHVLAPKMRTPQRALAVIHKQLQKACRRLRAMDYYAGAMTVSVKMDFTWRWEREVRCFPTQDTTTFARHLNRVWEDIPPGDTPTQVRVVLWKLVPAHAHTPSLFEEDNNARRIALQRAMDQLTLRYGNQSVFYAPSFQAQEAKAAPMRISFTHIPDLKLEQDD